MNPKQQNHRTNTGYFTEKTKAVKALFVMDDGWGANFNLVDQRPNIRQYFENYNWEVVTCSVKPVVIPCAYNQKATGTKEYKVDKIIDGSLSMENYDALILLPGQQYGNIIKQPAALELIKKAYDLNKPIAAFCRGVKVLAAAGIINGYRVTGHPDYADQYEKAGGQFIGYKDLQCKQDAPPPVIDRQILTGLRSNYYRGMMCEMIRTHVENYLFPKNSSPSWEKAKTATFAFMITPEIEKEGILLAKSIRRFTGEFSRFPIYALVYNNENTLSEQARQQLKEQNVIIHTYTAEQGIMSFPLADKIPAAAKAEELAENNSDVLIWLDADVMFVREPIELFLEPHSAIGFRPVHHKLIGNLWEEELTPYWELACRLTGIDKDSLFPVYTTVDRKKIAGYFNAGFLIVRPGESLLREWFNVFSGVYRDENLKKFYAENSLYALFLHQVILSLLIQKKFSRSETTEISFPYNYPLLLHKSCPEELKPGKLEDLYMVRYDQWDKWFSGDNFEKTIPLFDQTKEWIQQNIRDF